LDYDGIYLYQASYGQGVLLFSLNQNGQVKKIPVALQQAFKVLNTYYIPLGWDDEGRIFMQYMVHGLKRSFLMVQGIPYKVGQNVTLTCEGIFPNIMWTGLEVSKDPGANIVWIGSVIMIIGLIIAFFISHHRTWVRLEKEEERENRILFVIGGLTNKEKEKLEREIVEIFENIKKEFAPSDINRG
jgi:cytochrome c biogenesis protein